MVDVWCLRHFFYVLLFTALLTGCKTAYVPNLLQMPLMSEGDETQVSLGMGTNGYGVQLAYSPYYHWNIIANGAAFSVAQDTAFEKKYTQKQGEIGTGFYTRLNKFARFETIMGLGSGNAGLEKDREFYRKLFIQPAIGFSTRYIDAGVSTRLTFVQHHKTRVNGSQTRINDNGLFFEPGVMARVGYEQVKFSFQGGMSMPLVKPDLTYLRGFFGVGLHITFAKDFERYNY